MAKTNKYRGCWALVTGANSGIGFALSERMASYGINLVLVGRNQESLQRASKQLADKYTIKTITYTIDLASEGAARLVYDFCNEHSINVDILVNNAGVFIFNDLINTSADRIEGIINLHIRTVTEMCRLFAGSMSERGGGHILNLASYSVWMPLPGIALYSATKAYIKTFSLSFAEEVREYGVYVTAVSPAGVSTDLYGLSKKFQRLGVRCGVLMTPEKCARKILNSMFRGMKHSVPGWYFRLFIPIFQLLPHRLIKKIRKFCMKYQK